MWNNYKILNVLSHTLIVMVVCGVLYSVSVQVITSPLFPLKEISVAATHSVRSKEGVLQQVTREQIEQTVQNEISGNFFTVDLATVQRAFLKLPWVRSMTVQREWPYGLIIRLEEHVALARWGSEALVNTYGEIFYAELDKKLPVFIGPTDESVYEVTQRYNRFSALLVPLKQHIAEINLSPRHAWKIRLMIGTILELGHDEVETRLARYTAVYNHSIAQLSQQGPLAYLDLRYPNGFALRMPAAMQQAPHKPGVRDAT